MIVIANEGADRVRSRVIRLIHGGEPRLLESYSEGGCKMFQSAIHGARVDANFTDRPKEVEEPGDSQRDLRDAWRRAGRFGIFRGVVMVYHTLTHCIRYTGSGMINTSVLERDKVSLSLRSQDDINGGRSSFTLGSAGSWRLGYNETRLRTLRLIPSFSTTSISSLYPPRRAR